VFPLRLPPLQTLRYTPRDKRKKRRCDSRSPPVSTPQTPGGSRRIALGANGSRPDAVDTGGCRRMQPEMHLLLSVLGKCAESASMDERRAATTASQPMSATGRSWRCASAASGDATVADWWRRGTARLLDRSRRCPYRRPARRCVTPRPPSMVLQQNASRCGGGCGVAPGRLRPRVADAVDLHRGGDACDDDHNRDGNRGNGVHRT